MDRDLRAFIQRHRYALASGAVIAGAIALRLVLTLIGWPHSDSEEGTMGLEAMHILLRGETPVYLYGQNYMGVGEAYVASFFFRLFGTSVATLRLSMILFYGICLVGVFWIADQLYSRRVALASLVVLSLGTPFLVQIELLADGGKVETMACGAIMFALATWFALTRSDGAALWKLRLLRIAALGGWGLVAGFGLYTYPIVAPFVLTSGLLIAVTCWRELREFSLPLLLAVPLAGFLIGYSPAILYAIAQPAQGNPIAVFLSLRQTLNHRGSGWHLVFRQFEGTLLYTLPSVTGLPQLYPKSAMPLYGPPSSLTPVAVIVGGGWSAVYLTLLGLATFRPARALRARRAAKKGAVASDMASTADSISADTMNGATRAKELARLLYALTAWGIIASYIASPTAANNVGSGRYMIGLLVMLPAILWPLLEQMPAAHDGYTWWRRWRLDMRLEAFLRGGWTRIALVLALVGLLAGAVSTIREIPPVLAVNQHDTQLAEDLLSHGITRFYSDYWSCDLLIFETREGLICSVVLNYGLPGYRRYLPYTAEVQADANAPYVLVTGSMADTTFQAAASETGKYYSTVQFDGYTIYSPSSS